MTLAIRLMAGLLRAGYWGGLSLMRGWNQQWRRGQGVAALMREIDGVVVAQKSSEDRVISPPVSAEGASAMEPGGAFSSTGQPLIRYGDGFSVVCRCYPGEGRVVRSLWLDYGKLRRRYGAMVERRLRLRAGEGVQEMQALPHQAKHPTRPWGRIALTEVHHVFPSLQDQGLLKLMDKTVEECQTLIEAEVPDGLLHKRPWHILPPCPAPEHDLSDVQKRRKVIEMSMEEVRAKDAKRKSPLASTNKSYPTLIQAPAVRTFRGVLESTGFVERTDPSGRKSRTFFAEVRDEVQRIRHTGSDLQRALLREQIVAGDTVEIFAIGLVPMGSGKYKKKIWSARKVS
ncbi:MAG: hypothetical protein G3H99_05560 [Ferrovum sp.]|nr:hypothetical protein [Ferrovum sp.]NDU86834.1 hypothetical protein [Ferrovum sp.]